MHDLEIHSGVHSSPNETQLWSFHFKGSFQGPLGFRPLPRVMSWYKVQCLFGFNWKGVRKHLLSINFRMLWMKVTWFALILMEICENCNFGFETCFNALYNIFKTVADFLTKKIEHVYNSHLHNRPCDFLAPLPQGGHKKFGIKCAFLLE